jgi:hypothetical protein
MFVLKYDMFVYNIILMDYLNFDHIIFSFLYRIVVTGSMRATSMFRRCIHHPFSALS